MHISPSHLLADGKLLSCRESKVKVFNLFVRHNNRQPGADLPTMWIPFKAENVQEYNIETVIESISHLLQDDLGEKLAGHIMQFQGVEKT